MTTPNEELILKLRGQAYTTCRPDQLCDQAADLLQSLSERIKKLEAEIANIKAVEFPRRLDKVTKPIIAERDTLRAQLADAELHTKQVERGLDKATAQLAAIAATEPAPSLTKIEDPVTVPRGLLGAACRAIAHKDDAPNTLEQLRQYTVGNLSPSMTGKAARSFDKAWSLFCSEIGEDKSPYPGMIGAFEAHYGQSFKDKDWRNEASVWAQAWSAAGRAALANAELVEDVERYRWLRDYLISPSTHFDDLIVSADKADTLDGVIDAARAKGTK